jgi:hypothetical protein
LRLTIQTAVSLSGLPLEDITTLDVTRQPDLTRAAVMLRVLLIRQLAAFVRRMVCTRVIACVFVNSCAAPDPTEIKPITKAQRVVRMSPDQTAVCQRRKQDNCEHIT